MLPKAKKNDSIVDDDDLMSHFYFKGDTGPLNKGSERANFCCVVLEEDLVECLWLVVCGPQVEKKIFCSQANTVFNKVRSEIRSQNTSLVWKERNLGDIEKEVLIKWI